MIDIIVKSPTDLKNLKDIAPKMSRDIKILESLLVLGKSNHNLDDQQLDAVEHSIDIVRIFYEQIKSQLYCEAIKK